MAARSTDEAAVLRGWERARRGVASLYREARTDPVVFNAVVLKDERTGVPIKMGWAHKAWHDLIDTHDRAVIWSHVEAGKAVPLDTPIPTPGGWVTMGDLRVGSAVFGSDGAPRTVTAVSEVQTGRQVFEVQFSDGDTLRADADHNWMAWSVDDRAAGRAPRVVTTREMLERLRRGRDWMWTVPVAAPAQYPERGLPVHPYVLGAWLGDGDSDQPCITMHEDDREIGERCLGLEGGVGHWTRDPRGSGKVWRCWVGVKRDTRGPRDGSRLRTRLRQLALLGAKRIPATYLTASVEQRRELLAGLLDTDGSVDARGGKSRVELCLCDPLLAGDALELIRSLGFKASMSESDATLGGVVVGRRWRITFTSRSQVFCLARKAVQLKLGSVKASGKRTVVGIRPVASVPVRCISVDSPDRSYLMGRSYTVTHNTQQISVGRVLYELGVERNLRVAIVSNTHRQAEKIVRTLANYIERSDELHNVFGMKPGGVWSSTQLYIEREHVAKDPSVQACGIGGAILGSRIDLLILDDVLDYENCRTPEQRKKLIEWYHSTLAGRLTQHSRVVVVGTAFNPDDLLHHLARSDGWVAQRYPVIDDDPDSETFGRARWPERWPLDRIAKARQDFASPAEFARQMMCVARSDEDATFKQDWIERCKARGEGRSSCAALERVPKGYRTITGVDLAVQQHSAADKTALFTIAVHPDETREVLNVESGRWTGPEIVGRLIAAHQRYHSLVIVENNASQDFILQFARGASAIPLRAFTTGRNKAHPDFGVASIGTEMMNGKWIIPNERGRVDPEIDAWIQEMLYYDPRGHTGDRLMASWFAREGARMSAIKAEVGRVDLMSRRYEDLTYSVPYVKSAYHEDENSRRTVLGPGRLWWDR